jgi:hypothetical protein
MIDRAVAVAIAAESICVREELMLVGSFLRVPFGY